MENKLEYVSIENIPKIHQGLKKAFSKGNTLSYEWRVSQLNAIIRMLSENKKQVSF